MQKKVNNGSFKSISDDWLKFMKPQLKESSIVKYSNTLKQYLLPEFHEREITEITKEEVLAFRCRLLVSGGKGGAGLSPKTVTDILSVLKNIFVYASEEKACPVTDISRIFVKQSQKPMRILSRTEQQSLSRHLCDDLTPCNLGILVCLYTGLRIGEICALRWDDILFNEHCLYVHQTMRRIQKLGNEECKTLVQISSPKSDSSVRRIPIPDEIFRLIAKAKMPADTYFLTGLQNRYIEPRTMQNRFKAVIKKCNIRNANFHALRHTFATRCVELGFDIKSLSEILGHASVNITLNRYVHPSMELKQKNMNLLCEFFAE